MEWWEHPARVLGCLWLITDRVVDVAVLHRSHPFFALLLVPLAWPCAPSFLGFPAVLLNMLLFDVRVMSLVACLAWPPRRSVTVCRCLHVSALYFTCPIVGLSAHPRPLDSPSFLRVVFRWLPPSLPPIQPPSYRRFPPPCFRSRQRIARRRTAFPCCSWPAGSSPQTRRDGSHPRRRGAPDMDSTALYGFVVQPATALNGSMVRTTTGRERLLTAGRPSGRQPVTAGPGYSGGAPLVRGPHGDGAPLVNSLHGDSAPPARGPSARPPSANWKRGGRDGGPFSPRAGSPATARGVGRGGARCPRVACPSQQCT